MKTSVVVKTNIRINGKDYNRPEDMPPEIRAAYERAMASLGGRSPQLTAGPAASYGDAATPPTSTITFNGQHYGSADEMPADVRALYDDVIATLRHEQAASGAPQGTTAARTVYQDGGPSGSSIQPRSVAPRLMVVVAVILAFALLAFGRLAISP